MRACLQRVLRAKVTLSSRSSEISGQISSGLVIFLGVTHADTEQDAIALAKKCCELRIFEDEAGKMNRSLLDASKTALIVSQFTLYADCRKGRRPSFTEAASPEQAERLYQVFVKAIQAQGITVATGVFRTEMHVELVNDGPVTIWLDTALL